jgi:hypothetical protein
MREHRLKQVDGKPTTVRRWVNFWANDDSISALLAHPEFHVADKDVRIDQNRLPTVEPVVPGSHAQSTPAVLPCLHRMNLLDWYPAWHAAYYTTLLIEIDGQRCQ